MKPYNPALPTALDWVPVAVDLMLVVRQDLGYRRRR